MTEMATTVEAIHYRLIRPDGTVLSRWLVPSYMGLSFAGSPADPPWQLQAWDGQEWVPLAETEWGLWQAHPQTQAINAEFGWEDAHVMTFDSTAPA